MLERQVQEVKATLQNMLALLREEVEEDVNVHELQDDDEAVENKTLEEEEEEEEEQYFSDSWDIWRGRLLCFTSTHTGSLTCTRQLNWPPPYLM